MVVVENKRILFLASSAPKCEDDSTSPFILQQAMELQKLGWEVEIIAPHAKGLKREEVLQGVRIRRYRYMPAEGMQTLCYGGGIMSNLKARPLRILQVPCLILSGYFFCLKQGIRHRPALIHSHWLLPSGLIGCWLQWFFGVPHVAMVHGGDVFSARGRVAKLLKRWVVRSADKVIGNSAATAIAVQQLVPEAMVTILPTGVDVEAKAEGLLTRVDFADNDTTVLICIGRMVEEKGLAYALEAVMRLAREGMKVKLLAIGEGPMKLEFMQAAEELDVADVVQFIGAVPPAMVKEYLAIADVFVGASCTGGDGWIEGQGNSFVEAMAAGVPVVASKLGGITDAVIHERTGLLVPERDAREIALAIRRLKSDKALAEKLILQAKDHVRRNFSSATNAQEISRIYTRLLQPRATGFMSEE